MKTTIQLLFIALAASSAMGQIFRCPPCTYMVEINAYSGCIMDKMANFKCSDGTVVNVDVGQPGVGPNAKIAYATGFKAAQVGQAFASAGGNEQPPPGYSWAGLVAITLANGVVKRFAPAKAASTTGVCGAFGPYVAGSYRTQAQPNEKITGLVATAGTASSGYKYVQYLQFLADVAPCA